MRKDWPVKDPDELAHPVVNSAPQRPRTPVEGGSTHVVIDKTWQLPAYRREASDRTQRLDL